jgi:hypothetical protein
MTDLPKGFVPDNAPPAGFVLDKPQPDVVPAAGGAPAKITVRPPGAIGYVDDAARALAQGATFGFADELAAAGNTLPLVGTGKSYEENLAAEKARNEEIPGAIKYPGEIAGAVGGAIAAAPATAAGAAAIGLSRLPAFVRAALAGGAGGAAFGAGNADPGLENRISGAAGGALLGTGLGAAAYPVVQLGSAAVRGIRNAFSPRQQVAADLGRAMTRDETTPAQLAADLANAQGVRPGVATLGDVGGENVRGLVERVAQTPGAGRTQVIPALTSRQEQQAARLTTDLGSLTGSRRTALEATKQTMEQRAEAADPLYKEAFNFNARAVPEIVDAFQRETSTGFGKQIINSKEFRNTLQTEYGIKDPTEAPLMVVIDAWKKTADDLVGSAVQGGNKNIGRVIGNMRDRVVGVVDQHNPKYAEARNAWSGPSQYLDAIQDGAQLVSPKLGADEVRASLQGMTDANREAYVTGALAAIFRKMGNDPAKMADFTQISALAGNAGEGGGADANAASRASLAGSAQF